MTIDYQAFLATKRQALTAAPVEPEPIGHLGPDLTAFRAEHEIDGPWHYVYGLYDPRTGELRYIGKSDRPRGRLSNQLNEKADTHRCHWIQELRSLGLRPVQVIIDAVPAGTDWQGIEIAYIAAAREAGYRLTNGTAGGDGVMCLSEESRAKMRATWLGRKHKPESIAKIAAASRGRRHTDEWRTFMHERMRDREFSPEHRQKIRESIQKLTPEQVREIRQLLADRVPQRDIAKNFGVHQGSISNIARGITYRDVR